MNLEWIETGAQATLDQIGTCEPRSAARTWCKAHDSLWPTGYEQCDYALDALENAAASIAAVEPLIRADERERNWAEWEDADVERIAAIRGEIRAQIAAEVEGLPDTDCRRCRHPHADHQPVCTAWVATIPGLPDAEPCGCGGWLG